jgi:hypothetical protein
LAGELQSARERAWSTGRGLRGRAPRGDDDQVRIRRVEEGGDPRGIDRVPLAAGGQDTGAGGGEGVGGRLAAAAGADDQGSYMLMGSSGTPRVVFERGPEGRPNPSPDLGRAVDV